MDIQNTVSKSLSAIENEIIAVRERPSQDVLIKGVRENNKGNKHVYIFETNNQGLRFAEEIKAVLNEKNYEISIADYQEGKIWLEFPEDVGMGIDEVFVEWENDFVLRRMLEHLHVLSDKAEDLPQLHALLNPELAYARHISNYQPQIDASRNGAQTEAIHKAMVNNILFVWGPPGTGKTTTLGYINANYIQAGKSVLFVSNTNRAVDVGLLSTIEALENINPTFQKENITRFGDAALDDERLDQVLFKNQVERKLNSRKDQAVSLSETYNRYVNLQEKIDEMMLKGEEIPEALDLQCQLLGQKVDEHGGEAALEDKIDKLLNVNERVELMNRQFVATTMAKVCTSELFYKLSYDAVVIDEASMAGVPYMLLMAAKSKKHIVAVGDPMQLPPIAITKDFKSRDFLEKDIFTYISGAETTDALFNWHDDNPEFTCFFDTQYRLKSDLAGIISAVFYNNRLKTASSEGRAKGKTVALLDSSKYGPFIQQEYNEKGFRPNNQVHLKLVEESVRKLSLKYADTSIGVIVPFRNSVYKVRKHLSSKGYRQVEVGTIHTFQGREKEVIIFDTVMSGEMQNGTERHYSVRPFDEDKNGLSVPRLLNVAFSRSKEMLVVIADMNHVARIYHDKFLGQLLNEIKRISL